MDAGIPSGTRIIEYTGVVYTRAEYLAQRAAHPTIQHYTAQLDSRGDHFVDATIKGNNARYINHTCSEPNAFFEYTNAGGRKQLYVVALRDILYRHLEIADQPWCPTTNNDRRQAHLARR